MNWIKFKEVIKNTSLVLGSLIFALLLGEICLRLFFVSPILTDPILGNIGLPGKGYDANGFRNEKVLNQADIVAIGDSQTYGNNAVAMSEPWPQTLGALTGNSVYQMAFGGYGPAQYSYLIDRAIALKPRLVVVGFYFGNDLEDAFSSVYNPNNNYWQALQDQAIMKSVKENLAQQGNSDIRLILQTGYQQNSFSLRIYKIRRYLRSHLRIYAFLGDASRQLREKLGLAKDKSEIQSSVEDWIDNNPNEGLVFKQGDYSSIISPSYRLSAVDLSNSKTAEGWRLTQYFFQDIQKRLADQKINLLIVKIPTKEAVIGSVWQKRDGQINDSLNNFLTKEDELSKTFFDFCKNQKISCVDAFPGLEAAVSNNETVYPQTMDGHPVPKGYHIIAEQIYNFMQQSGVENK